MHPVTLFSTLTLFAAAVINAYDPVKMLCLVNQERTRGGLQPLGLSQALQNAAQEHSDDQARMGSMTHDGSDGSQPGDRVESAGYNWQAVAENVAYGYGDEEECMREWMNSPGHRENIMGPSYTHFGSAVGYSGSTPYYTQDFGGDGRSYNFPVCPSGDSYPDSGSDNYGGSAPSSNYGGSDNYGGSAPSSNYGGGSAPSSNYGGSSPSSNYGGGSAPSRSNYGGGSAPSSGHYGGSSPSRSHAPSSSYGGSAPSSGHRPTSHKRKPKRKTTSYGGHQPTRNTRKPYGDVDSNRSGRKPTTSTKPAYGNVSYGSGKKPSSYGQKPSSSHGGRPSSNNNYRSGGRMSSRSGRGGSYGGH